MGMPQNSGTYAQGFLDRLSTEQLLDLLRTEPEDGDGDLTNRILEVIEERENAQPSGLFPDIDVNQAWEDFQKYFNTPDGTDRPLYPTEDPEDTPPKAARVRTRLLRRLLPMAAVIAVAFSGMAAAQALGVDVFGALARWTSETFRFASEPEAEAKTGREASSPENEAIRRSIQDALDQCGITAVSAPAWYPEGSELAKDVNVKENTKLFLVLCDLTYGGKSFSIHFSRHLMPEGAAEQAFEKDASNVESYYSAGRLFYIMENLPDSCAAYTDDQTSLLINGELSLEDLKKIIDSIGE